MATVTTDPSGAASPGAGLATAAGAQPGPGRFRCGCPGSDSALGPAGLSLSAPCHKWCQRALERGHHPGTVLHWSQGVCIHQGWMPLPPWHNQATVPVPCPRRGENTCSVRPVRVTSSACFQVRLGNFWAPSSLAAQPGTAKCHRCGVGAADPRDRATWRAVAIRTALLQTPAGGWHGSGQPQPLCTLRPRQLPAQQSVCQHPWGTETKHESQTLQKASPWRSELHANTGLCQGDSRAP